MSSYQWESTSHANVKNVDIAYVGCDLDCCAHLQLALSQSRNPKLTSWTLYLGSWVRIYDVHAGTANDNAV